MSIPALEDNSLNREDAERLTSMLMRLFTHWKLTYEEQAQLLGMSTKTHSSISRYKKGEAPIRFDRDTYDRARFILAIHKSLRLIFPMNSELAYAWPKSPNRFFNGRTPVEVVAQDGFLGLVSVHSYLENYRGGA